jgi:hypothetical protein
MQTRSTQRGEVFRELAPDLDAVGEFTELEEVKVEALPFSRFRSFVLSCFKHHTDFANSIDLECTPPS